MHYTAVLKQGERGRIGSETERERESEEQGKRVSKGALKRDEEEDCEMKQRKSEGEQGRRSKQNTNNALHSGAIGNDRENDDRLSLIHI